jgi:competence protein ComGC
MKNNLKIILITILIIVYIKNETPKNEKRVKDKIEEINVKMVKL